MQLGVLPDLTSSPPFPISRPRSRSGHRNYHSLGLLFEVARAGWVVATINYRLAGKGHAPPYPYALFDAKRAVAWLRTHAAEYGGDPSFIVAAGESAGGHLALMLGLTPNVPSLQPEGGIEGVDTRVEGVVDLYGVADWSDTEGQWAKRNMDIVNFLEKMVVKRAYADHTHEYVRGSPVWWLRGSQLPGALAQAGIVVRRPEEVKWTHDPKAPRAERVPPSARRNNGSGSSNGGGDGVGAGLEVMPGGPGQAHLTRGTPASSTLTTSSPLIADMCVDRPVPPILVVHGDADTLVPFEESSLFFDALKARRARDSAAAAATCSRDGAAEDLLPAAPDAFLQLPGAHHAYNFVVSPRSMALADAVTDWLENLYERAMARRRERASAGAGAVGAGAGAGARDAKL